MLAEIVAEMNGLAGLIEEGRIEWELLVQVLGDSHLLQDVWQLVAACCRLVCLSP